MIVKALVWLKSEIAKLYCCLHKFSLSFSQIEVKEASEVAVSDEKMQQSLPQQHIIPHVPGQLFPCNTNTMLLGLHRHFDAPLLYTVLYYYIVDESPPIKFFHDVFFVCCSR